MNTMKGVGVKKQAAHPGARRRMISMRLDRGLWLRVQAAAIDRRITAAAIVAECLQREVNNVRAA